MTRGVGLVILKYGPNDRMNQPFGRFGGHPILGLNPVHMNKLYGCGAKF